MTVRMLLAAVWRRRWLALAVLLLDFAAVALALFVAPKGYTASSTITAAPQPSLISSTGNLTDLETTLAQIVNSRSVLTDVQRRIGAHRSVATLRDEVSGQLVTGTVLIRITVVDQDPHTAADIANTVADVLPAHDPSGGLFLFTRLDHADAPPTFSTPNVRIIALAGVVLGVVLAVAAALIRDAAAGTVDSAEDLREVAGTDVFGAVARPRDPSRLTALDEDALAFRALRVGLEFAGSDEPTRILVMAPAVPDGQDQWLAVNLAVALAQVRHRVLLVDTQLERKSRHPALAAAADAPGLYDLLRGATTPQRAVVAGPVDGVQVLPVGDPGAAAPSDLVEMCFHDIIAKLSCDYDVVLVSAPSPTVSDDASVMAVGGKLLIAVPGRRVRAKALRQLVDELQAVRLRIVGCVLIGARRGRARR